MNKEQEFKHFYKSDVVHSLVHTEKERKNIVLQIILSAVIPLLFIPILAVIYIETHQELVLIPVLILLVGAPIYVNKLFGDTMFYKNFKRKIIAQIIKYINPTLDYDNLLKVDDVEYDNSKFFNNSNTIIYGDDHVSGIINDVRVEFSELLVEFKDDTDKKTFNSKYQFRGLFFLGEFKNRFATEVIVKTTGIHSDEALKHITDHSDLNKYFKTQVLSNPAGLNTVLTPKVIESLLTLQAKIHNEFLISFVDNKLYFGVFHDEDLFEPTLFQSMMNYDKINGYFEDLYYPLIFIEEITKEHK